MTDRSTEAESRTDGRGNRAEGLRAVRFVFSDGLGTMESGEKRRRRV